METKKFIRVPLVELPGDSDEAKRIMCKKDSGAYFGYNKDDGGSRFYSFWEVVSFKQGEKIEKAANNWALVSESNNAISEGQEENIGEEHEENAGKKEIENPTGEWISSKTLLQIIEQLTKK